MYVNLKPNEAVLCGAPYIFKSNVPDDFEPQIFLDIQFHMENGSYSWRNGPEIQLSEWSFSPNRTTSHPFVPKWVDLRIVVWKLKLYPDLLACGPFVRPIVQIDDKQTYPKFRPSHSWTEERGFSSTSKWTDVKDRTDERSSFMEAWLYRIQVENFSLTQKRNTQNREFHCDCPPSHPMIYKCFQYHYDSQTNCITPERSKISGCNPHNYFCKSDLKDFGNKTVIQRGLKNWNQWGTLIQGKHRSDIDLDARPPIPAIKWINFEPVKARGPAVLYEAIQDCKRNNSTLISTLEPEFKMNFKAIRLHHAFWARSYSLTYQW